MNTKLYVGNLHETTTEGDLYTLFSEIGTVASVSISRDPETGSKKNFGYVQMSSAEGAKAASQSMNGRVLHEHKLTVIESRERK